LEIKELVSKIKQKRKERNTWHQIMNTMWDSRKAYKEAKDIYGVDYLSQIATSYNTYTENLWNQLKKKS